MISETRYHLDFSSDDWDIYFQYLYNYDLSGNLIEQHEVDDSIESQGYFKKTLYKYDINNNLIEEVYGLINNEGEYYKGKKYTDLNYDWLTKGWDVSAVSFHKLLKVLSSLRNE